MTDPTRDSRATVLARAERDPEFVLALLDELAGMTQENERLRGLLREARYVIQTAYDEVGGYWYATEKLLPRIDAALDTNSAANRVVRRQSE